MRPNAIFHHKQRHNFRWFLFSVTPSLLGYLKIWWARDRAAAQKRRRKVKWKYDKKRQRSRTARQIISHSWFHLHYWSESQCCWSRRRHSLSQYGDTIYDETSTWPAAFTTKKKDTSSIQSTHNMTKPSTWPAASTTQKKHLYNPHTHNMALSLSFYFPLHRHSLDI